VPERIVTMETSTRPGQFVDAEFYGWWSVGDEGYVSYRDIDAEASTYEAAVAEHGPVRPVVPAPKEDLVALRLALISAGRQAVTTLVAALGRTWEARMSVPKPGVDHDWDLPMRALTAGRPGAAVAAELQEATGFGRELLYRSPKRVDQAALETITEILWRWTDGPEYVELAGTLGGALARLADELGPEGWITFADQWLQPGSMAHDDFVLCYRWLYAASEHFDGTLLWQYPPRVQSAP
jgi:hypothetical protein